MTRPSKIQAKKQLPTLDADVLAELKVGGAAANAKPSAAVWAPPGHWIIIFP
jgi:hypothetical protein